MDAIYFIKEDGIARRIDSSCVEPMKKAGYTILKMLLDGKNEMTQLEPDEKMPKNFIQESRYGMVMRLEKPKEESEESSRLEEQQKEIEALKEEIRQLKGEQK